MRTLEYLSHSSLQLWESQPEQFVINRLSPHKPPREPQGQAAAVGSAFDAYVKAALAEDLFGPGRYSFDELFESSVEPQNRDFAKPAGQHCFDRYFEHGFYWDILTEMKASPTEPRFESEVRLEIAGVPLLGKPDAEFSSPEGVRIVHDWKVSGYCSKSATSPTKNYRWLEPDKKEHKNFKPKMHGDVQIDETPFELTEAKWASQTSIYAWLSGLQPGDTSWVASVHQLACKPGTPVGIRVAEYRAHVSADYQHKLVARLRRCWDAIRTGHILIDLPREQSDARVRVLIRAATAISKDDTFFQEATRVPFRG